ncbi:hypothetical protein VM1G_11839 [Cytospora mali]|uniref:Uncharacterized protein n=1 Tax=Cytospora mali TaxID=578113 RepID=A0A194W8U2_CYTMA|nr:hypothetical protein VM1G_11839 [Valsa mali]
MWPQTTAYYINQAKCDRSQMPAPVASWYVRCTRKVQGAAREATGPYRSLARSFFVSCTGRTGLDVPYLGVSIRPFRCWMSDLLSRFIVIIIIVITIAVTVLHPFMHAPGSFRRDLLSIYLLSSALAAAPQEEDDHGRAEKGTQPTAVIGSRARHDCLTDSTSATTASAEDAIDKNQQQPATKGGDANRGDRGATGGLGSVKNGVLVVHRSIYGSRFGVPGIGSTVLVGEHVCRRRQDKPLTRKNIKAA